MADSSPTPSEPIIDRQALIRYLEQGCKPRSAWRIGTEHEKFGFRRQDLRPLSYEGEQGIRLLLTRMAEGFGWEPILEAGNPIGLRQEAASVTLEPGGQLELSGAPQRTIHQTQDELNAHLDQLAAVCREMGMAFVGVGAQPKWRRDQIPWMPKGRYQAMRRYLPTKGAMSLDMMTRTATVQANLDFGSEADMVAKFRLALALQPLATALFANSPFLDGVPSGFLSMRAEIWRHTDPDRCGDLPFVFEPGFGFERYVDYALAAPMLFLYRDGVYHEEASGVPFAEFMAGRLPGQEGLRPTLDDWSTHLTTLFPDVRLKHYLETRGADAGDSATLCALPALWKGLLYDDQALEAAWALIAGWSPEERAVMQAAVPQRGLATPAPGFGTFQELALRLLEIARAGLHRQEARNADGCDESIYLDPLYRTAESGLTPAERLLEAYQERWGQSVDPLFQEEEFESFYAKCG